MTDLKAPPIHEVHVFIARGIGGAWDTDYGIVVLHDTKELELYARARTYSEWTLGFPDQQPPQMIVRVHYQGEASTPGQRAPINILAQSMTSLGLVEIPA